MKHSTLLRGIQLFALILMTACTTTGGSGGLAPLPPALGDRMVNAQQWLNEPLTLYFSKHGLVAESNNTVGQNDLFFQNPFAFQVQLKYQFPTNGFELQDAAGHALTLLPARANTQSTPVVDPGPGPNAGKAIG